tara:strand:+ start:208 stop:522 length:315 start_codon:yes stop_codon:yes gene_type:complete
MLQGLGDVDGIRVRFAVFTEVTTKQKRIDGSIEFKLSGKRYTISPDWGGNPDMIVISSSSPRDQTKKMIVTKLKENGHWIPLLWLVYNEMRTVYDEECTTTAAT